MDLTKDAAAAAATPTKTTKSNWSAKANGQKRKQPAEEVDDAERRDGETVKKPKVQAGEGGGDNIKEPKVEEEA